MNPFYNQFIQAIHHKEKLIISYYSKKDNNYTTRTIAPLDYGPKYKANSNEFIMNGENYFLFYDFDGSNGGHITPKKLEEITNMKNTGSFFDLAGIISLPIKHPWHIPRNWGTYS